MPDHQAIARRTALVKSGYRQGASFLRDKAARG
jgi:hypothetical protein